jgi:hypothetical protein
VLLRESGKRIELADDADDRLAGTERRHERRRDVGDTRLDLEAAARSCCCRSALLLAS